MIIFIIQNNIALFLISSGYLALGLVYLLMKSYNISSESAKSED